MILTAGKVKGAILLNRQKGQWEITCDHEVMRKLKRMFERIPKEEMGTVRLGDSPNNAAELQWIMGRWRLEISADDRAHIEALARVAAEREAIADRMLAPSYTPSNFELALPPRDYQRVTASYCLEQGFLLCADEMGLGKTVQGICVISDPRARPAVVVCPTHLPRQWEGQIQRFLPGMRTYVVRSGKVVDLGVDKRGARTPPPDVIILNYHKLHTWAEYLATFCNAVIYDEAQAFRHEWADAKKTHRTRAYGAALHLRDRLRYRFALTGTPVYNRGGEIRNVLEVLVEDAVGTMDEFAREWCGGYGGEKAEVKDPRALGVHLREKGLMIRRTRADVNRELPRCTRNVQMIETDPDALKGIKTSIAEFARRLLTRGFDGETKRNAAMELDWRLRQATGISKAKFVADFVRMLLESGEEKVVLFGYHKAVYAIWRDALSDFLPVFYTGDESPRQKEATIETFTKGKARILVMSLRAGVGVDGLQNVCSTVVVGELDWSPAIHNQNVTRIHRDGQEKPVFAHFLVTNEGSDPVIMDVLGLKVAQAEGILDPNAPLFEQQENAPEDRMKALAEHYLEQYEPKLLEQVRHQNAELEARQVAEREERALATRERREGRSPRPSTSDAQTTTT